MAVLRKATSFADLMKLSIAFVIGLSVKTLFLFLGTFVQYTWSSSYLPTLQYFMIISGLGAFLAGLFAGFLSKDKTAGAFIGVFCALLPTFVYSIVTPAWTPIGGLIFLWILGPGDVFVGFAGAAVGVSINFKMVVGALLIALAFVSLVFVHGLITAPIIHYGDLIIDGNESLIIENCNYEQYGNIIVRDNGTLILRNSLMYVRQQKITLSINVSQEASLILENAELTVTYQRSAVERVHPIRLSDKAVLRVYKVVSRYALPQVVATNQSEITISDSKNNVWGIVCHDTSTVTAHNAHIGPISIYDSANVSFQNSSANDYWCYDNSSLRIEDSIFPYSPGPGYSTRKSVFSSNHSSILIRKSLIDEIRFRSYQGQIIFENSTIGEISIDKTSDFHLTGNVTVKSSIETFKGMMTRNYQVVTTPHTQLNITDCDSASVLLEVQSDTHGQANFDITFTTGNYTNQCKINNERTFNVTSTTPIIYP